MLCKMHKLKKQLGNIFLRKGDRNDDTTPKDDDRDGDNDDDTSQDDDIPEDLETQISCLDFTVFTKGIVTVIVPSRHWPDFHLPQSQIYIVAPHFHRQQSQICHCYSLGIMPTQWDQVHSYEGS